MEIILETDLSVGLSSYSLMRRKAGEEQGTCTMSEHFDNGPVNSKGKMHNQKKDQFSITNSDVPHGTPSMKYTASC